MVIVRDKMTRCARKNGAVRVHFRLFSFAPAVLSALPPCPAFSVGETERERKLGERGWSDGDGVGEKKRTYGGTARRQRGTVRSDASRRRGERKPATSQPDCKTLCKTRRESQDDWFVRPFTAADLLSSAHAAVAPVKYARATNDDASRLENELNIRNASHDCQFLH